MANSKCLSDSSSLSVMIDDDLCAFESLHHEGLEWTFLLEKRGKKLLCNKVTLEWTFLLEKREKKLLCNKVICKFTLSFTPIPSFSGIYKVRKSAPVAALRKKEREDETQFTTKIGGKLVWVPVISFCKVSFPVTHLMPYYAKTWCSRPLIA
jgi:hypothetical protein